MPLPERRLFEREKHPTDAVLVIKHGALGDIFQAFSAFSSIRRACPAAYLALLTTPPYETLLRASPWFDEILIDRRAPFTDWKAARSLWLIFQHFDRVIDLQNSGRTRLYKRLLQLRPKHHILWLSHHDLGPDAPVKTLTHAHDMHTLARQDHFLKALSITPMSRQVPDWLPPLAIEPLPEPYIVLVPGASGHRPAKKWPLDHFSSLITHLENRGLRCVITGTKDQKDQGLALQKEHPALLDLTGRTTITDLAHLMARASFVIGNDTGPLHIAAIMDTPTLTFFSAESDPRRCAPLGLTPGRNRCLSCPDLAQLSVKRVTNYLDLWLSELLNAKSQKSQRFTA